MSLTLGHFIFGYATGLVVFVLALWLGRELWRKRHASREKRHGIQCALCGVIYEDASGEVLPPCPQCGHPNERFSPPGI